MSGGIVKLLGWTIALIWVGVMGEIAARLTSMPFTELIILTVVGVIVLAMPAVWILCVEIAEARASRQSS
jgi:hypothetical protein